MNNKFYKLFTDCIPVRGHSRSIIYDLTRKSYDFIPNSLFDILKDGYIDLQKCYHLIDISSRQILDEYITYLLEKEYIFEINDLSEVENYPKIEFNFDYPSEISNAIIDYNGDYKLLSKIIQQLNELNCNFVVLRLQCDIKESDLKKILSLFDNLCIFSIEILMSYNNEFNKTKIGSFVMENPRINRIILYNSPIEIYINDYISNGMGQIVFTSKKYEKNKILSLKDESSFVVNIKLFSEALNYNTFFNKKVYISELGEIKNSPFTNESFGNLNYISLKEIIQKTKLKDLWKIKKDEIQVCQDCEFRYMCLDNRNLINKDNIWQHTEKCSYNPYNNTWKD